MVNIASQLSSCQLKMDFFVLFAFAIGSICIQLCNGATTSSPIQTSSLQTETGVPEVQENVTSCPRFNNRQDNQTLYIPYIEGRCEMVVTVETVKLPQLRLAKFFKRKGRVIRRPVINFRSVGSEETGEPTTCESLPYRPLGPFVFVDTVVGECQMLLRIKRQRKEEFDLNFLKQERERGLRPWKRQGKRQLNKMFTFAPAYEYLDEVVY
ncbi:uncharacterized protein [Argopecten irradians]|uniref:uncharacterized protein n=1 Tax=Argopecten irradians TaxID=31199 RepID=UPI0037124313